MEEFKAGDHASPKEPIEGGSMSAQAGSTPASDEVGAASARATRDRNASGFEPRVLDRTVIALPLIKDLAEENAGPNSTPDDPRIGEWAADRVWKTYKIIIDVNLQFTGGRVAARRQVRRLIGQILTHPPTLRTLAPGQGINEVKSSLSQQYLFATLEGWVIEGLVREDSLKPGGSERAPANERALYRIWPDFPVHGLTNKSISTVKADAARNAFSAIGEGIVWAVLDSGIDVDHPHFAKYKNLKVPEPLKHRDFTSSVVVLPAEDGAEPPDTDGPDKDDPGALTDPYGHGTHVAGIIAGQMSKGEREINAKTRHRDERGEVTEDFELIETISGMAPCCMLLSMKVLDEHGAGEASSLITAIEAVQKVNGYGRRLLIHGVNMSVGYDFEPEWFACGQSPLCVEVNRLVRSGVVVVVAAGNTGYGWQATAFRGTVAAGMELSINDPGNADLAITVGSTHRDMPHVYGVSYFSSKGPTGDGRMKPDLVAPGEKIISCMSKDMAGAPTDATKAFYREESGTSMAAPHVSGVIAAFLSVRREFIDKPEAVKDIFLASATDLKRSVYFQGKGLVDLMRALQSV
jgi:serine protease AprX